jgi:hypothetical protein
MGHTIIDAVHEVSDNRLDYWLVVVFAGEGLNGVNRVPDGHDDYFGLAL